MSLNALETVAALSTATPGGSNTNAGIMTTMPLKSSMTAFGLVLLCLGHPGECKDRAPITVQNQGSMPIAEQLTAGGSNSPMPQPTRCRPLTRTHGHHTLGLPISISEWERLDDDELDVYFQADEANGIRRKSCGPTHAPNGTIRWISGIVKGSPDFEQLPRNLKKNSFSSGPCCPNGHTCECLINEFEIHYELVHEVVRASWTSLCSCTEICTQCSLKAVHSAH